MERQPTSDDTSAIHAAFIGRCLHIARQRGRDLRVGEHKKLRQFLPSRHLADTIIGKQFVTPMLHLAFANQWTYTAYNSHGLALLHAVPSLHDPAPRGEVQIEHLSMGRPTNTQVTYTLGDNSRVYAHATIDSQEPPPPKAISFLDKIGVPVQHLGWTGQPPFRPDSWEDSKPLDALRVLAILRVVNSQS